MENNQVLKSFLNESFINVSNIENINYFVKGEEFNLYILKTFRNLSITII